MSVSAIGGRGAELRAIVQHTRAYPIAGATYVLFLIALLSVLIAAMLLAISIGAVSLPLGDVWGTIAHHLFRTEPRVDRVNEQIIWNYRTPRVLLAAVVGAGLSVAGTTLQALVRNPLADPYVLGVSSGASLAAVSVIVLGPSVLAGLGVSLAAFLGAVATMALVLALGQRGGRLAPPRLILSGVAIGSLCSSITSYLQIKAEPQQLQGVLFWLLGTVSGAGWSDLRIPSGAIVLISAWLLLRGRELNALLVGDESAIALGIDVNRFRLELLLASSLLTGAVVAVSGGIGFVGLMIPHVVRMLVGSDHRRVLPAAALLGATYLVVVDLAARTLQRPVELPLSIFTAVIGAPFFLWLMRRSSRLAGSA